MQKRNENATKTALLIHPMLSCGDGIEQCVTNFWGTDVHCFIPDLSAHGEAASETYHGAKEEAQAIHDYLAERGCTHLQLGFGASLGGVVLFELLNYPDLTFDHVFFEGVSFYERAPLLCFVLTRVFLSKHRKAVKDPELSRRKMSAIYGEAAGPAMAKRFIAMNEASIRIVRTGHSAQMGTLLQQRKIPVTKLRRPFCCNFLMGQEALQEQGWIVLAKQVEDFSRPKTSTGIGNDVEAVVSSLT